MTRAHAVVHYKYFLRSLRKVAKEYNVSKSSLQRWLSQSHGHVRKSRSRSQVNEGVKKCIEKTIIQNPFSTWHDLACAVSASTGKTISRSTAGRILRSTLQFSRKKAHKVVNCNHEPETILNFCTNYVCSEQSIICIDEAFYVGEQSHFGYARRGCRLSTSVGKTLKRRKYTVLMAISKNGIVAWKVLQENCNKQNFAQFIASIDAPPNTYVLMDNLRVHKTHVVCEALREKSFVPLFTPPYSPKMNAIENLFGVLKQRYRKKCPCQPDVTSSFDYKGTFESILREYENRDLTSFFKKVQDFVCDTISNRGVDFKGYDT